MYRYNQKTGDIFLDDTYLGSGYSGHGEGKNNHEMQAVPNVGPIPIGKYYIDKAFDQIPGKGPCVMHLWPLKATEDFGRSGFMIHGDNATHDASEGCIIQNRAIRTQIAMGTERLLEVFI